MPPAVTRRTLSPDWGLPPPGAVAVQLGLHELGTPLRDVTFVVVDLETTGGSAASCAITEIGAVKVRGGQVLGEFQTLVDCGGPVPATIQVLTGITTAMLVGAPRLEEALPSFLEFARGAVLVAHNAPFDIGFLRAAAARCDYPWPGFTVVDTVRLARRVVTRDEAPNHKLGTLAALFGASETPVHRALADARATVDVLHALLGRMAPLGVTHLEDLASAADPVPDDVRRRRTLADDLPDAPGVYVFRGPREEVLYVGVSTRSIRARVRSYFTSAERRSRMTEMVRLATRVDPVVCDTPLEARVRELRLIAEHSPRYNRRSRRPERMPWVRLTVEPHPRLSVVRGVVAGAAHIGPMPSAETARLAVEALHETFPLRRCSGRLPVRPAADAMACVLAEMGRCTAPCVPPAGRQHAGDHAAVVDAVRDTLLGDPAPVVRAHAERLASLVGAERFEEAAGVRDRLSAFLRAASSAQRSDPLARSPELVAARREPQGGWEVVLIRYGRLAGTARTPRGADPLPVIAALQATGEQVAAPVAPATAAHPEETALLLEWLEQTGVRLVHLEGTWALPVHSAAAHRDAAAAVDGLRPARTPASRPPGAAPAAPPDSSERALAGGMMGP